MQIKPTLAKNANTTEPQLKAVTFKLRADLVDNMQRTVGKYGTTQAQFVAHAIEREIARIEEEKKPLYE